MTLPALNDLLGTTVGDGESTVRLKRTVKSWLEVPSKITLTYIDKDLDHAQNVVSAAIQGEEEREIKMSIPIVGTQSQAKDLADKTLYLERLSRITYAFTLPRTHLKYDPGDIIPMLINGITVNLLITDIAYDPRGMLTFTSIENDIDLYDISTNLPDSISVPPVQRIVPPTDVYSLNIPYVNDADRGATSVLVALDKINWQGASLFVSYDNGANYTPLTVSLVGTKIGVAANVLPAANPSTIDYNNTLLINNIGTLESITIIEMLNGKNTILVGDELLRFADAELQLNGSYKLSALQRGIRGTENHMSTHEPNEICYLMDRKTNLSGELNRSFLLKALSIGSSDTVAGVSPISILPLGVGLRPYAPGQLNGNRSVTGDLSITWQRRDRLRADWRGAGEIPMSETSEKYEIDIYNALIIVRTIAIINSKSITYTAEQQIEDFGSIQSSVKIRIYQISSSVGRGSHKESTL